MNQRFPMGALAGLALVVLAVVLPAAVSAQPRKPNVVFVLADNVGYGALGPYGGGETRGAPGVIGRT